MRRLIPTIMLISIALSQLTSACRGKEAEPIAQEALATECQATLARALQVLFNSPPVPSVENNTIATTLQPYINEQLPENCLGIVASPYRNVQGDTINLVTFLGAEQLSDMPDIVSLACNHSPNHPLSPEAGSRCWDAQQPQIIYLHDENGNLRPIIMRRSPDGNQLVIPDFDISSISPQNRLTPDEFLDRVKTILVEEYPGIVFVEIELPELPSPMVDQDSLFAKYGHLIPVYVPPSPLQVESPPTSIESSNAEQMSQAPELITSPESVYVPEAASANLMMIIPQGEQRKIMRVKAATTPAVRTSVLGLASDSLRVEEIFDTLEEEKKVAFWLRWTNLWRDKKYEEFISSEEITVRGGGAPIQFRIISSFERNGKVYYACFIDATRTDIEQMTPTDGDIIFEVYYIEANEFDHVTVLDHDNQPIPSASQVFNQFHLWQTEKPFNEKGRGVVLPRQYIPPMLNDEIYTTTQLNHLIYEVAQNQQTVPGYIVDSQGYLHPVDIPIGLTITDDHSRAWGFDGTWPGDGGSYIYGDIYLPFGPFSFNDSISQDVIDLFYDQVLTITGQYQPPNIRVVVNASDIGILSIVTPFTK